MGCDIHMIAQVRVGDRWRDIPLPDWWPCERMGWGGDPRPHRRLWFDTRNYAFFGVLAGVRWLALDPIAEGRGLPPDLEGRTVPICGDDAFDLGDHSFSWCTAAELLAYPWETEREDVGGWVLDTWLPCWRRLADDLHVTPAEIRLVFGFDS